MAYFKITTPDEEEIIVKTNTDERIVYACIPSDIDNLHSKANEYPRTESDDPILKWDLQQLFYDEEILVEEFKFHTHVIERLTGFARETAVAYAVGRINGDRVEYATHDKHVFTNKEKEAVTCVKLGDAIQCALGFFTADTYPVGLLQGKDGLVFPTDDGYFPEQHIKTPLRYAINKRLKECLELIKEHGEYFNKAGDSMRAADCREQENLINRLI